MSFNQSKLILHTVEKSLERKIDQPIFYSFNGHSIRFDMSGNSKDARERYNTCIQRSQEVFSEAFRDTKELTVFIEFYSTQRHKEFLNNPFLFEDLQVLINKGLSFPNNSYKAEEQILYDEETNEINGFFYQYLYKIESNYAFLEPLFNSSAGREIGFSQLPALLFYVFDLENKVIFHLYDDRGLDLVCMSKKKLMDMFNLFEGWILEYDLATVKKSIAK